MLINTPRRMCTSVRGHLNRLDSAVHDARLQYRAAVADQRAAEQRASEALAEIDRLVAIVAATEAAEDAQLPEIYIDASTLDLVQPPEAEDECVPFHG